MNTEPHKFTKFIGASPRKALVAVIVSALALALILILILRGRESKTDGLAPPILGSGGEQPLRSNPDREYTSDKYSFSLSYPENLRLTLFEEENGETLVFQGPAARDGFQIFIVPYSRGDSIDAGSVTAVFPDTEIHDSQAVDIDGARGVMFFGKSDTIGKTREVWFAHRGYLYVVTTYADLDAWLSQVFSTWKFAK